MQQLVGEEELGQRALDQVGDRVAVRAVPVEDSEDQAVRVDYHDVVVLVRGVDFEAFFADH